ncbi:MAG: hypothetical protein RMA76_18575 [Deltaproteobacteria bacterium]|jgi:hypothetical protein
MSRGRELLERQFHDGPLSPEEDRELQALLRESEELRAEYRKLVEMERGLEGADIPNAQLERLLARGAPPARQVAEAPPVRRLPTFAVAGGLAAACVLIAVLAWPEGGVGVRGGEATGRTAWLSVFLESGEGLEPATPSVPADAGWAFAYTNLRESKSRHLAVVGLDAAGHAHWFHPAYTDASQSPRSVRIEAGAADRELGEVVRIQPAPGPMRVCGLFTVVALDVAAVDRELERSGRWPSDAKTDCHTYEVQPSDVEPRGPAAP